MDQAADCWHERAVRDAVLAGDAAVWGRWVEANYAAVAGYVRWRCGGAADLADDVLQDAWLTAARSLGRFDPGKATFAGWVCGIAANVVRNRLRSRQRAARRFKPLGEPAAAAPPPDDQAERVAVALAALPEKYERVLRAKYLDGLSVAAIAAAWGETEKAVESTLTRARQAFREAFRTEG
ncbi:MAG: sigma-70 family RNA polymerase sigma factor [Gemmataceae bacterium]